MATLTTAAPSARATGDDDALIERALRIAQRTALGVLGSRAAAEDVAQEVALIALKRRTALRNPAALDAWLHRIAVHAALREWRRDAKRRDAERRAATGDAVLYEDDPALAAAALLADLPPRQRAALTLRYVHDLDDAAIARALGCRRGTVRSLLSRGIGTLRSTKDLP